jgi:hypothetical protein
VIKMSLEQYIGILRDETSIRILNFCKTPKNTEEIDNEVWDYSQDHYPILYKEKSDIVRIVATRLGNLEDLEFLKYSDGKWQTTDTANDTISKYFGTKLS